ncbi:MAG: hypothetical protein AAF633_23770 [Chloroflexota bacterium]
MDLIEEATPVFTIKTGSADEAELIQTDLVEAQRWCNFTLMQPTWLPEDVSLTEHSLRPEQGDGQSASYRLVGQGDKRTFTLKQFLFDFAPPAYDHPALWRNPKTTKEDDFPDPKPFVIGDHILWIGHDHRRFPAATIGFRRVRVELTVTNGHFSEDELVKLFSGLTPVDPEAAERLKQTPYAELAYQRRYQRAAISVPLSYWAHQRQSAHRYMPKLVDEIELPFPPPELGELGYELDSFFLIESDEGDLVELDLIFEAKSRNGAYIRLIMTPPDSAHSIRFPPEKYTQGCQIESLAFNGHSIHIAWLDSTVGPYELSFVMEGWPGIFLIQPAAWTDRPFAEQIMEKVFKKGVA